MTEHFERAEALVTKVHLELGRYLCDGCDPIDCYNPETLDQLIHLLIVARSEMAIGRNHE